MAEQVKHTGGDVDALRSWWERARYTGYPIFPAGPQRDRLRRAGLIERWNPSLKATGRLKPWRLTPAGRAALSTGASHAG